MGDIQSRIQLSIKKSFCILGVAAPCENSSSREKGSKLKIALPASTTFFLGVTAGSRCFLPEVLYVGFLRDAVILNFEHLSASPGGFFTAHTVELHSQSY